MNMEDGLVKTQCTFLNKTCGPINIIHHKVQYGLQIVNAGKTILHMLMFASENLAREVLYCICLRYLVHPFEAL